MGKHSEKKLNELTVLEAIEGLKKKEFTSMELVSACLDQIVPYDKKLGVFVTLNGTKFGEQALEADRIIKEEGPAAFEKRPLLGIPYACKDNYCTEGWETTASSNILKGFIPPYESTVTQKLKDAGAILLGKTNMDAFAHGSSTETSDFFPSRNPWNPRKVPGGSSGGSAIAVAAHMCTFAMGSETAGSIRGPAAWCGITGIKPTYGRVSRYGVIAMASSTDSPGPLTKTVADGAYILQVIAGKDVHDATSSPLPVGKYFEKTKKASLKGVKIGKPKSYFDMELEPGVRKALNEACDKLHVLGAEIVEMDLLDPKYSIAVYTILQRSEVSSNLARLDGIRYGQNRDAFGFEARKRMMLGAYTLSAGYYDAFYSKAQRVRTIIVDDFNKAFKKVDMIIGPTMPCVALDLGESDKSSMFGEMMDVLTEPSSIAGLPAVNVPCGFSDNMPVGLMLIGPQFSEEKLIAAAQVYEDNTEYHKLFPQL